MREAIPGFGDAELVDETRENESGLHTVMRDFCLYFGKHGAELSERQLRALGKLLDEAVAIDDMLENAVSTCFLEHVRQIGQYKPLAPYVTRCVKDRT